MYIQYIIYLCIFIFTCIGIFRKRYITILTAIIIGSYVGATYVLGVSGHRYFSYVGPLMILLIIFSIREMTEFKFAKPLAPVIGFCILLFLAVGSVEEVRGCHDTPVQRAVDLLKENYHTDDLIIFDVHFYQAPFEYYASLSDFYPTMTGFPISIYDWWKRQPYKGWAGPVASNRELEEFVQKLKRDGSKGAIWLVLHKSVFDPFERLLQKMTTEFPHVKKYAIDYGPCYEVQKKKLNQKYKIYKFDRKN